MARLAATSSIRSSPMRSYRPNSPVLGIPIGRPITESASSTVTPCATASTRPTWSAWTPTRLARKPGVSRQCTTPFPSSRSQNRASASITSGRVSGPRTSSSSRMKRTGLKKCVMQKSRRIEGDMRSASRARGRVDVLDDTMEPGRRIPSSAS